MNTRVAISLEEYLKTSFEEADCEYLDGEIVERNRGELPHALLQGKLLLLLSELGSGAGLQVVPEIRLQISATRYRVADIAVWRSESIGTRIPTVSPFLVVEILSPEDRMVRMQPKIQEYLGMGVDHVWLIDPYDRKALSYSKQDPVGQLADVLKTVNPHLEIPLETLWQCLPES
jgi:Uma2 family endonuclease